MRLRFLIQVFFVIIFSPQVYGQNNLIIGIEGQGFFALPKYPPNSPVQRVAFGFPFQAFPITLKPGVFLQYEFSPGWIGEFNLSTVKYKTTCKTCFPGEPWYDCAFISREVNSYFNPVLLVNRRLSNSEKKEVQLGLGVRLAYRRNDTTWQANTIYSELGDKTDTTIIPGYTGLLPVFSASISNKVQSGAQIGLRFSAQYGYKVIMEHQVFLSGFTSDGKAFDYQGSVVNKGSYVSLAVFYKFRGIPLKKILKSNSSPSPG